MGVWSVPGFRVWEVGNYEVRDSYSNFYTPFLDLEDELYAVWEFSLVVARPSPFVLALASLILIYLLGVITAPNTALQCSLLLADTIIGSCKATLPNCQIKVTAKYKSSFIMVIITKVCPTPLGL